MNDRNTDNHRITKITLALGAASVVVAIGQLFVANFAGVFIACLFVVVGGSGLLWRHLRLHYAPAHGIILGFVIISAAAAGVTVDRALSRGIRAHSASPGTSASPSGVSPTESQPVTAGTCRSQGNFASPQTNARVNTSTQVRGNARLCPNKTLWVLIQEGGNVWVHGKGSMTVSKGEWSSDTTAKTCQNYCAHQLIFNLVATDPAETGSIESALNNTPQNEGAKLPEIPKAEILDSVTVMVQQ